MSERDPFDAELEQLRAENAHLKDELDDWRKEGEKLRAEKVALQAEIDRLRALNDEQQSMLYAQESVPALYEEIKRLRADQQQLCLDIENLKAENERLKNEQMPMRLENERLKAERHTTKEMLEDVLKRHGAHYGLGRGGLGGAGQSKP